MRNPVVAAVASLSLVTGHFAVPAIAQSTLPYPSSGGPQIQPTRPGNDYQGTIRCESRNERYQRCAVQTDNRVQLQRTLGGRCRQNREWGFAADHIWVNNGCRAEFRYGRAGGGYPDRDFAGTLRCESRGNRYQQCDVPTNNRVELIRRVSGTCNAGRQWGYTADYIWVNSGCRADFGYGYNNLVPPPGPQPEKDKGPSTGLIIGGIVVAGGLLALLASKNKKKSTTAAEESADTGGGHPPQPPATITANLSGLPSAARSSMQNCLNDAARQVGVTGGTRLTYDRLVHLEQGNGGWRIRAAMTAAYPDGNHAMEMYCRATPTQIIQLDLS